MDKNDKSVRKHGKESFTRDQVEEALVRAGGVQTEAARILGCSKTTLNGYVRRYPYLQDVIADAKDRVLDLAESKLIEKIEAGNLGAIIFFLKCQGKHRGYVEKGEAVAPPPPAGGIDFSSMSDEELAKVDAFFDSKVDTRKPN